MSEFHQRPFSQRFGALGDQSEGVFASLFPNAHRLGLNRPSLNLRETHVNLRNTPDFLLEDGLYEVMGFSSRGGSLKLKFEKAHSLLAWSVVAPTNLFVYDSHKKRYWCASIREWLDACYLHAEVARFPDNDQPYWALKAANFPDVEKAL